MNTSSNSLPNTASGDMGPRETPVTPPTGPIRTVLILVAMAQEAEIFIATIGLQEQTTKTYPLCHLPCKVYEAEVSGLRVVLVTNGRCERFDCNNVSPRAAGGAPGAVPPIYWLFLVCLLPLPLPLSLSLSLCVCLRWAPLRPQ